MGRQGALRLLAEPKRPPGPFCPAKKEAEPAFPIPGTGEALWGKSRWSMFVLAESIKHPGYVNHFVLNSRPTGPDSCGYVVAGSKPTRAARASYAMQVLLREEHLDDSEVEWDIATDADTVEKLREWAEEEAERAYESKNYWWKHGKATPVE